MGIYSEVLAAGGRVDSFASISKIIPMKRMTWMIGVGLVMAQAWGAENWMTIDPEQFREERQLRERINVGAVNYDLLAAAVFHETNRVRARHALPRFTHLPALDRAAEIQVNIGSFMHEVSHENPMPDFATLTDRVKAVGLSPAVAAENIAITGLLEGPGGYREVMVKQVNGREVFLDAETFKELRPRTYEEMAATVVARWMGSPGHRSNILNPELHFLGVALRTRRPFIGIESLYAVQVFFTPVKPVPPPPRGSPRMKPFERRAGSSELTLDQVRR
jgi:uncharacterized protein YkwD